MPTHQHYEQIAAIATSASIGWGRCHIPLLLLPSIGYLLTKKRRELSRSSPGRDHVLTKNWNPKTGRFDVTFDLPAELDIEQAAVAGEFNDWSETADRMETDADGRWSTTVSLEPGRSYRFRYHLGDDRWENDWNADGYVDNDFGGSDSVVTTPDEPSEPPPAKAGAPKKAAAEKTAAKKAGGVKKSPAKKAAAKKSAAGSEKAAKKAKKAAKKAAKRPPS
jgi:hypothetical protein